MNGGPSQYARRIADAERDLRLHKLARPVDVTDAKRFPNIAEAIAHARRMRGEPIEGDVK